MACAAAVSAASTHPAYQYQDIKRLYKKTLNSSQSADLGELIDKARVFIDRHSTYKRVAQVYYILGNALTRVNRTEEAIQTFQHLTKDYPTASYVAITLLEMGLIYDKLCQHAEANTAYQQLIDHPKHGSRSFAKIAKEILALEREQRTGELPSSGRQGGSPDALVRKKAIEFHVKDLDGAELSLAQYRDKII